MSCPRHSYILTGMLIVLDVGNTNTTIGTFEGKTLQHSWRLTSDSHRTVDEYGILCRNLLQLAGLERDAVSDMAISSVVPSLSFTLSRMAELYFGVQPLFVSARNCGMPILYDDPDEVGPDRIVDAVAALEKYGSPAIIVDFGTATTFNAVSKAGEYLGGIICPGIQISADALFQRAARLRRIDNRKPERLIGTNPTASMESGLYYGNVSLVEGVIQRMVAELGEDAHVISTGGLAPLVSQEIDRIQNVDMNLTLEGLQIIFERNRSPLGPRASRVQD